MTPRQYTDRVAACLQGLSRAEREAIRQEILRQLWAMFDNTTFIYNVNVLITPA